MNWVKSLFGPPTAERKPAADPFNFLMDQYVNHNRGQEAELLSKARQQFSELDPEAARQLLAQVTEAYRFAAACQYDARDGLLTQHQAEQQIRQRLPQLTESNLRALLAQTLVGAYR